jgi:hypothetical protein
MLKKFLSSFANPKPGKDCFKMCFFILSVLAKRRHDIQYNDAQHNCKNPGIQQNDTQHNDANAEYSILNTFLDTKIILIKTLPIMTHITLLNAKLPICFK